MRRRVTVLKAQLSCTVLGGGDRCCGQLMVGSELLCFPESNMKLQGWDDTECAGSSAAWARAAVHSGAQQRVPRSCRSYATYRPAALAGAQALRGGAGGAGDAFQVRWAAVVRWLACEKEEWSLRRCPLK